MHFSIVRDLSRVGDFRSRATEQVLLYENTWDDYHFKTTFSLVYVDSEGIRHNMGRVKIGQSGMKEGRISELLPESFSELPENCFSLGQHEGYYQELFSLQGSKGEMILRALHDLAFQPELLQWALAEKVTGVSLLRTVSESSVRGQFHRLATGGSRLTSYSFVYIPPVPLDGSLNPSFLKFSVTPESEPPTNIHVLIGQNGVGKTRLLQLMARAQAGKEAPSNVGEFRSSNETSTDFAGLVSVSFSAFDEFVALPEPHNKATGFRSAYIGLKKNTAKKNALQQTKNVTQLAKEFVNSVQLCRQESHQERWLRALKILEYDPIFSSADVASLAISDDRVDGNVTDNRKLNRRATAIFRGLSSGHKIVLLTITRLVETVEEKSLVLIDEPEAHLHPPLLAAFIRALSDLLSNQNGVAIIATHSPVVLQEVPRSCAWKLRRNGFILNVERPEIETFGENVGVLTREVFGLEVTQSGFHRMLEDAASGRESYEEVKNKFGGQLGSEALALLRILNATEDNS